MPGNQNGGLQDAEAGLVRAKHSANALKHLLKAAPAVSPLGPSAPQTHDPSALNIKPSSMFGSETQQGPSQDGLQGIDPAAVHRLKGTIESLLQDLNRTLKEKEKLEEETKQLRSQVVRAEEQEIRLKQLTQGSEDLRDENRQLREERRAADDSIRNMAEKQQEELANLKSRFLTEVEAANDAKKHAMEDLEKSYSEALRGAQNRNQDLRENERKAELRAKELGEEVEGLRAQLRQMESERRFLQEGIEDERRNFLRFKNEVQGKHSTLNDKINEQDNNVQKLQAKYNAVLQELNHEKADKLRQLASLREDLNAVSESRDRARSDFSRTTRELEDSLNEGRQAKQHAVQLFETVKELKEQLGVARDKIQSQASYLDSVDRERTAEIEEMEELRKALALRERDLQDSQTRAVERLKARKNTDTAKALQSSREVVESLDATLNATLMSVGGDEEEDEVEYERDVDLVGLTVRIKDHPTEGQDLFPILSWLHQILCNSLDVTGDRIEPAGIKRAVATESTLYSTNASQRVAELGEREIHASFNIRAAEDHRAMQPDDLAAELVVQARDPSSQLLSNHQFQNVFKHVGLHAAVRVSTEMRKRAGMRSKQPIVAVMQSPFSEAPARAMPTGESARGEPAGPSGSVDGIAFRQPQGNVGAMLDVFVVSARNLPDFAAQSSGVAVDIQVGQQLKGAPMKPVTKAHVEWRSSFRFVAQDFGNDILFFQIRTETETCGIVAVPMQRLAENGIENGWYDIRTQSGAIVEGVDGTSQLQLGLAFSRPDGEKLAAFGRLWIQPELGVEAWLPKKFELHPYSQNFEQQDLEGQTEMSWSIRGCSVVVEEQDPHVFTILTAEQEMIRLRGRETYIAQDWARTINQVANNSAASMPSTNPALNTQSLVYAFTLKSVRDIPAPENGLQIRNTYVVITTKHQRFQSEVFMYSLYPAFNFMVRFSAVEDEVRVEIMDDDLPDGEACVGSLVISGNRLAELDRIGREEWLDVTPLPGYPIGMAVLASIRAEMVEIEQPQVASAGWRALASQGYTEDELTEALVPVDLHGIKEEAESEMLHDEEIEERQASAGQAQLSVREIVKEPSHVQLGGAAIWCMTEVPGGLVAAGLEDGRVGLFSVEDRSCLFVFDGHNGGLLTLCVSDGILLAGWGDGKLIGWDLTTMSVVLDFVAHDDRIGILLAMKDGTVVSGSADDRVKVWRLRDVGSMEPSMSCVATLAAHTNSVLCLTMHKATLLSGGCDRVICAWDAAQGWTLTCALEGHTDNVMAIASVAGSNNFVSADLGKLRIWDSTLWSCVRSLNCQGMDRLNVLSTFGGLLAVADDRTIQLWDTTVWTVVSSRPALEEEQLEGQNAVCSILERKGGASDETELLSGHLDGSIALYS